MRASRGRGAWEGDGEGGVWDTPACVLLLPAPIAVEALVACVFGTVVDPLVAVFWVGCEAGCDGPAAEDDGTPLV